MGKSGKKVKSDKINALRKQYDAFLEEDKKRKDRNEFILGRLEDMRFSNTVSVPIHQQKVQFMRDYYTLPQRSYINKSECVNHKQLRGDQSISVSPYEGNLEETLTFKEISTKYILIPKLPSTFQRKTAIADSPMENITDTDWKTKYHILDELKKNEKETTNDKGNEITDLHTENNMLYTHVPLDIIHKENPLPDSDGKTDHNRHKNELCVEKMDQLEKTESLNISPEDQDIIQNNAEYIKNSIENVKDSKLPVEAYEKTTKLHEEIYNSKNQMKEMSSTDSTLIELHSTANEQEQIIEIKETKDYLQEKDQRCNLVNEINQEINETPNRGAQGDDNLNTYQHRNSFENDEGNEITKCYEKTNEEINQELNNTNTPNTELTHNKEEKHDSNNIILNDTEKYKADEDHFNSKELPNIKVGEVEDDPDNHVGKEHAVYATENDDYTNIIHQISHEPEAYSTGNENYTNEEYAYYDESHQQPYTSEINEHEESSQRYDPSYEQQYANNYEDPNMAQYQNQQYEMENTYEQQDINNIVYDNQNEGDVNYGYGNSENIAITDQPQPENIYNYGNEIIDNQSGHQQEYNESELAENVLDADSGLAENVAGSVNDAVKTFNNTEEISEKFQSDDTLP